MPENGARDEGSTLRKVQSSLSLLNPLIVVFCAAIFVALSAFLLATVLGAVWGESGAIVGWAIGVFGAYALLIGGAAFHLRPRSSRV